MPDQLQTTFKSCGQPETKNHELRGDKPEEELKRAANVSVQEAARVTVLGRPS